DETNNESTDSDSAPDTEVETPSEDNTNDGSNEVKPPTTPDTEVETPSNDNTNGGGNGVQSPTTPDSSEGTNNNDSQTPQPEETVTPNDQQSQNLVDSLQ
ncbi:MAG: hypothetical protein IJ085_05340, partial [Turicibacter sp.]|nr:hypothetical protein [Turicibacter sp.]